MSVIESPGERIDFPLPTSFQNVVHGLRLPVFSLKNTNASSRMMHYYSQQSFLLDHAETNAKGSFTGVQILWISILKDLLKTGIANPVISKLKHDNENYHYFDYSALEKYSQLEFIASLIVEYKSDIRLLVMPDGSYTFINYSIASNVNKETYYSTNAHISVPLFYKVQEVWEKISKQRIVMKKPLFREVTANEKVILDILRSTQGLIDEVVISLKQQEKPQSISINESIDPKTIDSLCKFLRDSKNCKVEIAYGDISGEPTFLRRKKTIKLPNNG